MAASVLSTLSGFGREIITAHYYGTRSEMDAFLNASTIPTVLFGVLNGALVAALIPTFSEYVTLGRTDEVAKLGSTVVNLLLLATTGLALLGWLLAPAFVPVIAHGFLPAEQRLVVQMVRWLMPTVVATSLSGVFSALLNANQRFLASALVWVVANLVTISVVVALHVQLGIFALVLGSVLGLFAQLAIQLPSILRDRLYRFAVDLRHPGLIKTLARLLPVAVGSGAGQINLAFDRYFASTLPVGSTSGISYATKIAFLPNMVVAGAVATVVFPLIAGQFATSNRTGIRRNLSLALRMVSLIVIPCAACLSVLAFPIVQTLFERGAFGASAAAFCASLLPFACVPLLAISYNSVLSRACYACNEVHLAVVSSIAAVAINVILSARLLPILGARGLLLANGIAGLLLVTSQIVILSRLIGGFEWKLLLLSLSRISLASLAMASVLYWLETLHLFSFRIPAARVFSLVSFLTTAVIVFTGVARMLRVGELNVAFLTLTRRFMRAEITPRDR